MPPIVARQVRGDEEVIGLVEWEQTLRASALRSLRTRVSLGKTFS